MTIPFHPLANLFPLIEGAAFAEMVEDVRQHGLREKIVVLDGQILDGRNRYRAGVAAGRIDPDMPIESSIGFDVAVFTPFYEELSGKPLDWVISKNLHRRHLTDSQRAQSAAELVVLRQGERTDLSPIGEKSDGMSKAEAAEAFHVAPRSIERALVVKRQGAPELVDAVKQGHMPVSAAEDISQLPVTDQLRILRNEHPREFNREVREARAQVQAQKKERRAEREAALADKHAALPNKVYGVILEDPEWGFEVYSRETGMDRAAENHYPTSSLDDILARPVGELGAPDSLYLCWITVPLLLTAGPAILAARGYRYVSHVVWGKDRIGTGYWFRNQHEILLVGVRGNVPAPAMGEQFPSLIMASLGGHSAKPDFAYAIAERYFPSLSKIELNARQARPGWDAWGLEAPQDSGSGEVEPAQMLPVPSGSSPALAGVEGIADRRTFTPDNPASKAEAEPILLARYRDTPPQDLADELCRPVNTVRKWAWQLGLSDPARNGDRGRAHLEIINAERKQDA